MAAQSVVRLGLESNQYERGLRNARKSFDEFTKGLGAGVLKLTAVSAAVSAVTTAMKVAKDAFRANESAVDEWGRTMESAKSIYQGFLQALNNGDISGYLSNITRIVEAAKNAYDAMDRLNTVSTILNPERARIQQRQTELRSVIRRQGAGSAAGQAAQAELKQTEVQLRQAFKKESQLNYNAFKAEVDKKLAEANIRLNEKSYQLLMKSFSDTGAFEQIERGARGSRYENVNAGKKSAYAAQRDTRNTNQKLLDIFTDEWRKTYSPYLTATYTALNSAASAGLGNARYLKQAKTGGGGGAKVSPQQLLMLQGMSALNPTDGMTGFAAMGGPSGSSASMAAWFSQNMFGKGLQDQVREFGWMMQDKEGPSRGQKLLTGMDSMVTAMNQLYGGMEDMGIKLPKSMQQLLGGINGLITVIQAIQAAKEAFDFLKVLFFSGGGVARAATGLAVPGNMLSGDRVPALLNSGEVVLNRAEVGNLVSQFNGMGGSPTVNGRSIVTGEEIVMIVNNYGKRAGYGNLINLNRQ